MPRFALASAAEHVPVTGLLDSARQRIGGSESQEVNSDQNL
jgi:hypothetical protein